jgi:transcriptional regulator with XRE-family HTH domain
VADLSTIPATSPPALGVALRTLRKRRGLSQAELAHAVGIQRSYLSQLENGDVTEQVKRVFDLLIALSGELHVVDRTR